MTEAGDESDGKGQGAGLSHDGGNLSESTYARIRANLMAGVYLPGQKLLLRDIAEQLGTSITPVREALFRLVAENALHAGMGRSLFVPVLTRSKYLDIVDLRLDLEGRAAATATSVMTRGLPVRLEEIHAGLARAKAAGDVPGMLVANEKFHFTLYEAAEKPALFRLIESLWVQVGPLLNRLYGSPATMLSDMSDSGGRYSETKDRHEHLLVIRGLNCADPDMVREAIRRDIVWGARRIADTLDP